MDAVGFWDRVDKTSDCWLWGGSTDGWGYGKLQVGGKIWGAHRWAWTELVGSIPTDKFLCHHCDVKLCVRPDHLYLGDARTNADDMIRRGRSTRGAKNPSARLTEREAKTIIRRVAEGESRRSLATEYGVSAVQIGRIANGQKWGHLHA